MEGRNPPPKATHPFPDQVNFRRFWAHKENFYGFAKFATAFCSMWFGVLYAHYWFSKDHPYILGIKLRTPEEIEKRIEALEKASEVKRKNFQLFPGQMAFKMDQIIRDKPNVEGLFQDRSVEFSDDVTYYPGMVVQLPPVPEEEAKAETKPQ